MALSGPRLVTHITKELAREPHGFHRLSWCDFGNDALIPRWRDFIPKVSYHFGRFTYANGRTDLRGVATIAGGKLHIYDVTFLQHTAGGAWVAENHCRVRHWSRADDQKVNISTAFQDGSTSCCAELVFFHSGTSPCHHRIHCITAQQAGLANAVELLDTVDRKYFVHKTTAEYPLRL